MVWKYVDLARNPQRALGICAMAHQLAHSKLSIKVSLKKNNRELSINRWITDPSMS